jgi:hypothetical protein
LPFSTSPDQGDGSDLEAIDGIPLVKLEKNSCNRRKSGQAPTYPPTRSGTRWCSNSYRVTALSAMHHRDTGSFLTLTPRRDRRHGRAMVLFASLSCEYAWNKDFEQQLETLLDEPGHARHNPSAGPFAADVEERSLEVAIANLMEVQLSRALLCKCGSKVSPRNDGCPAVIPAKSGGSRRSWSSQHW